MKIYRLPKKKPKGDPRLILRENPKDRQEIPMAEYNRLYNKLTGSLCANEGCEKYGVIQDNYASDRQWYCYTHWKGRKS